MERKIADFQKIEIKLMRLFILLCILCMLVDADTYRLESINKTVTNVNKLFASTDVENAIHCALKCQEFNCTSFTYGEKIGFGDCFDTSPTYYKGRQTRTNSGTVCQRWDSQSPHRHSMYFGTLDDLWDAQNFCRDPDGVGLPWCYTINPKIRWEACPIQDCKFKFKHEGCYDDDLSSTNYTGSINYTRSGKHCQRWDAQSPHSHDYTDEDFVEDVLSDVKNYCRDPSGSGYTWCYTTDPETRWEPCDVSTCTKYRNDNLCFQDFDHKLQYKGRWAVPMTNLECQRWELVNDINEYSAEDFPDVSIKEANNYCRNPSKNNSPLWCISSESVETQFCAITKCPSYHVTCYDGPSVKSYMGTWNKTITGRTCQRWDTQTPHSHNLTANMFEEVKLGDAENFCRDPTNSGELWCYTTDPKIEMERCGIGKCNGEKTCQLFNDETVVEKDDNSGSFIFVPQP